MPPTARGLPTARDLVPDSPIPKRNRQTGTTTPTAHQPLRVNERVRVGLSLTRRRAVGMMSTSTALQRPQVNGQARKEASNLMRLINQRLPVTTWAGRKHPTANGQDQMLNPTKGVEGTTTSTARLRVAARHPLRVPSRSMNGTRMTTWDGPRRPTVSGTRPGEDMGVATMDGIKTWKEGTGRDIRANMHDRPEHDEEIQYTTNGNGILGDGFGIYPAPGNGKL